MFNMFNRNPFKLDYRTVSLIVGLIAISFLAGFYVFAWTGPTQAPPGANVPAPINVGPVAQTKQGDLFSQGAIGGKTVCIAGVCREGWPDAPLSNLNQFTAGHLYPMEGKKDAWLRDGAFPFPYLTLENSVNKFGIDPNDPYATNWFSLAYSYWQPYTQFRTALFANQGDNSSPRNLYTFVPMPWAVKNKDDRFAFCYFTDNNGVLISTGSYNFCRNCAQNPANVANCTGVGKVYYADSTSNVKGQVVLQLRLKPGNLMGGLCDYDFLPGQTLASWGDPRVTNFRINRYQLPEKGICSGASIGSQIQARFVVVPRYGPWRDPIQNFVNARQNFTYMFESLGLTYLTWIQ